MGQSVVVLGAQWGDEGKGKIVDLLTERVGGVVRFQGGHNAGHTLVIGGGHAGRLRGACEAQLRAGPSARGRSRGPGDLASAGRASLVTDGVGGGIP